MTTATRKLLALKKRIRAVCGGTSASKTVSILMCIIDWCQTNHGKKFDVIAESVPHLDDGAIKDFTAIMTDRGYWRDALWNKTMRTYTFETGTVLKFKSVDKLGKAHGPRRHGLFLNEANNIPYEIYDQLEVRTSEVVWLDWNPSTEFWYYTEVKDRVDHDFITLTYLDALEALPKEIVESIESKKDRKNWWQVYGLGQLGEAEGKIYRDWRIIDEIPHEARLERRGLDFGYSVDPTVLIDVYYLNGGFILDERLYQKGLSNRSIADFILNLDGPQTLVVADSAEPKSIDELKEYGVNVIGATKGQGSVFQGIQFVQDQRISVTKRSLKTIKAYRNYLFRKDKVGKVMNEPDDAVHEWSNPMDAIRYALSSWRKEEPESAYNEAASKFVQGGSDKPFPHMKADEWLEKEREMKEQAEYERSVAQMGKGW